jgi:hypothetical protein
MAVSGSEDDNVSNEPLMNTDIIDDNMLQNGLSAVRKCKLAAVPDNITPLNLII